MVSLSKLGFKDREDIPQLRHNTVKAYGKELTKKTVAIALCSLTGIQILK